MQLDLFGGPARPHVSEPVPEPPPVHPEPPPVEVLIGQLNLLQARSVRLNPVANALSAGRFEEAAHAADAVRGEAALAAILHEIARTKSVPAPFAELATAAVREGLARGLRVHAARELERGGDGVAAGEAFIALGLFDEADRALDGARPAGRALVLRGNVAAARGQAAIARELYRRASWCDPAAMRVAEIADDAVADAIEEARELVPEPVEAWFAVGGIALGLWDPGLCEAPDPSTPPARFHAALVRSRAATRSGKADVAARRELKQLAPLLFARLLEEGLA